MSEIEVDKITQKGTSGISITDDIKLSSGKAIKNAAGTDLLTQAGVLDNVALGSLVTAAANHGAVKTATNASGSAPIFVARAWVNFNGTGTVAIRDSGNVSSITDNGTGDYDVNFTSDMEDANYSVTLGCFTTRNITYETLAVGAVESVKTRYNEGSLSYVDSSLICLAIFR